MTKQSQDDVTSTSCSMAGSFISDTITLNGAGGGVGGALSVETASARAKNKDTNNTKPDKIRPAQTCFEDEEENTENDQDLDDDLFDDDDKDGQGARTSAINGDRVHTEKSELLRALNGDLTTLEQLREQKKLLKSIQLRKEELKALEGRRKALEALKKLADTNATVSGSHSLVELPQK